MRRRDGNQDDQGYDSFLDIVANLVGILLILIIVIGAQAADAMVEQTNDKEPTEAVVEVELPKNTSDEIERDIQSVADKLEREEQEIKYRRRERDLLSTRLAAARHALEQGHQSLSESQKQQLQLRKELDAANQKLDELHQSRWILENDQPQVETIEHLPTPMAKTVFGKEIHFQLSGRNLLYIPWDELLERLKKEAPTKLWKMDNANEVHEKVGPILGFWLHYTIKRMRQQIETRAGIAVRHSIGVERFHVEAVERNSGTPVEQALQRGSSLDQLLANFEPSQTTITIWVYPDSFELFRRVRGELYQRGFAVAARPLPKGHPIGGSVYGSRSVAQ